MHEHHTFQYYQLIPGFIDSLKTRDVHIENPETFDRWAKGGEATRKELEAYVVEEFVVSTNYFSVCAGEESTFRLLPMA